MSTMNSNIKLIKATCCTKIERDCNRLISQGYKLWGEMKIDYNKDEKCYIYHQLLSFDKSL